MGVSVSSRSRTASRSSVGGGSSVKGGASARGGSDDGAGGGAGTAGHAALGDLGRLGIPTALAATILAVVAMRVVGIAVASVGMGEFAVWGWDAALYRLIAEVGYPSGSSLQELANWAYFPLWPLVLAGVIRLPGDPAIAVFLVGIGITVLDVYLLHRLVASRIGEREALLLCLAWGAAPPNWIYLAAYPEGLFVLLALLMLLAIQSDRPRTAALIAILVGLSRPQGVIWCAGTALWILVRGGWLRRGASGSARAEALVLAGVAMAGSGLWHLQVSLVTGVPGGWFALQRLPGWEIGFGFLPWISSVEAIVGLTQGVIDRRLAMVPVVVVAVVAIVGLVRRREHLVGRWPTVLGSTNALFLSGGIGAIPRWIGASPLIFLGLTGWAVGRRAREAALVGALLAVSIAIAVYNFMPGGSNP